MSTGRDANDAVHRRDWIAGVAKGALAFGGMVAWASCADSSDVTREATRPAQGAGGSTPRPLGLQLYTVRTPLAADLPGTLRQIAAIGYSEVELAGLLGATPETFRSHLDAAGLRAPSAHVPLEAVRDDLDRLLAEAEILGVRTLVVPWIDETHRLIPGYKAVAATLNEAGATSAPRGVRIAFHNQAYDHAPGRMTADTPIAATHTGWDILLAHTDPELVTMQMDVFWAIEGGADPLGYFWLHEGRFSSLHVKDRTHDGTMVDVGAGDIDYSAILEAARKQGLEHVFVEHDDPPDPLASARAGYETLSSLES